MKNETQNKRIFLISNMYPNDEHPHFGVFVKNTEDVLKKNGFLFPLKVVITEPNQKTLKKIKTYIKFYIDILKGIIKRDLYDIIYVHFISHSSIPVIILKLLTNKTLILNVHGSDVIIRGKIAKILSFFTFPLVKICDRIVVPSDFFKDVVKSKFKIDDKKIIVYPSGGINTDIFKPIDSLRKYEREDVFCLGYVSRIEYGKGWDIFINIIKKLNEEHKNMNIKGIMIGDGKDKYNCLDYIKKTNLEDKIEYLGPLSQKEIAHYLNIIDLFIFPTRLEESLGLVGLEAMACKTPVVGTNIGGIKTYINHEKNGFLANVNDVDDFVHLVEKYIKLSKQEKDLIATNAYNTAIKFNSTIVEKDFIDNIKNLLKE
ncbi:glycosyltransferase family 4 protein [Thermobrachium celere]|uniref:glycosyltransferase family 4 protein n=1 Tax=Thermobrachium celere TaxID=53422 RepID=UPI001944C688|nr:glycosyltransferase family 4 protein [Thermobrachium celere]GFR36229.1 hypothetical protein TCEA9_20410 [Thermobrachium celere]